MGKIIFFFVIVFALSFLIRYHLTQLNKRKGQEILKLYSQEDLKKVEVKISESRHSRFSNRGGTLGFLNSIMFYSENVLIFTQNEKYNFEEINITLPLIVHHETIYNIIIKNDEYILYIGNSKSGKKIQIYSDKENELLKSIFSDLKYSILKK